jgi:hypothetical protein
MSTLTMFLVGAVAAMMAAAILGVRRRKRVPAVTGVIGCLLLLGSLIAGLVLLPERNTPAGLHDAVGVLPPPPELPTGGRGFAVALATQVDSCTNPVTVTLVAGGTSEYWSDYRGRNGNTTTGWYSFVVVLPEDVTGILEVGLAGQPTDISNPVGASVRSDNALRLVSPVRVVGGRTVLEGRVDNWPMTLLPLLVKFEADWLTPRGLSTCYLRLPSLSGQPTATAVAAAVGGCGQINADFRGHPCNSLVRASGQPYVGGLLLSYGESIVTVRSGEVSPDLSVPPPPAVNDGHAACTCRGAPDTAGEFPDRAGRSVPDVVAGTSGGAAYSLKAIEGANGSGGCRSIAVITEDSAAYSRDLLILIIGATTGLGLTLIVQAAVDMVSPRGASDSAFSRTATTTAVSTQRSGAQSSIEEPRRPRPEAHTAVTVDAGETGETNLSTPEDKERSETASNSERVGESVEHAARSALVEAAAAVADEAVAKAFAAEAREQAREANARAERAEKELNQAIARSREAERKRHG